MRPGLRVKVLRDRVWLSINKFNPSFANLKYPTGNWMLVYSYNSNTLNYFLSFVLFSVCETALKHYRVWFVGLSAANHWTRQCMTLSCSR